MISGLLLVNEKGDLVLSRVYRDDISRSACDAFRHRVIAARKTGDPVIQIENSSFMYARHGDMYVVAVTRLNANCVLAFQYIYKLIQLFRTYFRGRFNEANVRQHFVLVYELLDETIDNGYPQLTSADLLKTFIRDEQALAGGEGDDQRLAAAQDGIGNKITGAVDWRQAGKHNYPKNEVYIDVLEYVNLLSKKGNNLRADVSGKIFIRSFLSGMPELSFGLNDRLLLENEAQQRNRARSSASGITIDDVTFHRCVRLTQFDMDRTVSFIPPDGEFEMMRYRITQNIMLPFTVVPSVVEHGRTRVVYDIVVKGNFPAKLVGQNVILSIPTPRNAAQCRVKPSIGKAKYHPVSNSIVWLIKRFPGGSSFALHGEVTLAVGLQSAPWSRPPITMEFKVEHFASSGLHVRFLHVVEPRMRYQAQKWVRYETRHGKYEIHI